MHLRYLVYSILLCCFSKAELHSQDAFCFNSTEGSDFWFGFMENRWGFDQNWQFEEHYVEITLTSKFDVNYTLTLGTEDSVIASGFFPANTSEQIRLNWNEVEPIGSENIENMGLHLVTDNVINVYAYNFDFFSSDAALIYPTRTVGTEYYAICYEPTDDPRDSIPAGGGKNSEFLVVATEDNTTVTIIPTKVTDQLRPANIPFTINLNHGEVYQVQSENTPDAPGQGDLTGSHVVSDKPIAFFSGSWAATVPSTSCCWDHLYEQIPPVNYWGSDFLTAPILSKPQDTYRIIASQDQTNIYIGALNTTITLDAGEFYEYELTGQASRVTANKPIMLMQYSQSGHENKVNINDPANGDPFTVAMFPITSYVTETTYEVYDSPVISTYYVNIIAPNNNTANILVDGTNIAGQFINIPNSNYSYAQIQLFSSGQHQIESTNPDRGFVAYQYGFGRLESYGYGIAFNMKLSKIITSGGQVVTDTISACVGEEIEITVNGNFDFYEWGTKETDETIYTTNEGYLSLRSFAQECLEIDSIYVHRLYADIAPIDTLMCVGETLDLQASAVGFRESTFSIFQRDSTEGFQVFSSTLFYQNGTEANTFEINFSESSDYLVGVYSDTLFCLDSSIVTFEFVGPTAEFEAYVDQPDNIYNRDPLKDIYVENWSKDALSFNWEFGDGNDTSFFQGSYTYENFGNYPITLYVEDQYGCWDTISKLVRLLEYEVFAQNAIYPSGNIEQNRYFAPIIKNREILLGLSYQLRIYNRWGAIIFDTDSPDEFWDGSVLDSDYGAAAGNYIWILTLSEEGYFKHIYRGSILLIY